MLVFICMKCKCAEFFISRFNMNGELIPKKPAQTGKAGAVVALSLLGRITI